MELAILLASIAAAIIAIGVVALGFMRWDAKRWVSSEVISLLKNDETPVAVYAHDARDFARAASEFAREALEVGRETRGMIIKHIQDREIHDVR